MRRPQLHYSDILEWADEYQAQKGEFPTAKSGRVEGHPEEKWVNLDAALRLGLRGLPGGSSLPRLLAKKRGHRNRKSLPKYTLVQILKWADAHHSQTGSWPLRDEGPVLTARGETWMAVEMALTHGNRGLPGGSSLAQLLAKRRGVRNQTALPRFSNLRIVQWADAHHGRTGFWPTTVSGPILESPGDTWLAVDLALRQGHRGLRGKSSLSRLLLAKRGVKRHVRKPPLCVEQILTWADAHKQRTGDWPNLKSGSIPEAHAETWGTVQLALEQGKRGLAGPTSLAKLLAERRGARNIRDLPKHTLSRILEWADAHFQRTGRWPKQNSGAIPEAPGENWQAVDVALNHGKRGLPGGSSLPRLLAQRRGVRNRLACPELSTLQLLKWADAHRARTGNWPQVTSGAIQESPGDTWLAVNHSLSRGVRGLPGGSSLFRLLADKRGVTPHVRSKPLSEKQILEWADAFHSRTGRWPNLNSGPIEGAPDESWGRVHSALAKGTRNLPGNSSLAKLLAQHRGLRNVHSVPRLRIPQIKHWIREYFHKTGRYPTHLSGTISHSGGEHWKRIDAALRMGLRGLPGGSSVYRLVVPLRNARQSKKTK